MMMKFVTALNAVSSQVYAFQTILLGCLMVIICHHFGITDTSISAGIVGAGINMLTHDIIRTRTIKGGDNDETTTFQSVTNPATDKG